MIKFETELDVQELELHRKLCLMDEIDYVIVEIEYYISKFYPANWWRPEEGGDLLDWNVKVTDGLFTKKQKKIIYDNLDFNAILDAIWAHYDKNKR